MRRFLAALVLASVGLLGWAAPIDAKGLWTYQSGFQPQTQPYVLESGTANAWKDGWIYEGGWQPFYSTITVSASNVSGSGSGASSSGSVTSSTPGTTTGGSPIGTPSFAWSYASGDSGIAISSASAQNPTWSETVSGAACESSQTNDATWDVTATDPSTGAQATKTGVTISLTWNNTTSCESPLSVSLSPPYISKDIQTFGDGSTALCGDNAGCSDTMTAVPSGGSGVYTSYAWTFQSGDSGITNSSSSSQTGKFYSDTIFTCGVDCTTALSDVWRLTVTDSEGHTAHVDTTVEVSITETND